MDSARSTDPVPSQPARRIDHCVLPVADLTTARGRLTRLGFAVAPVGRHPFGTENACVYFADDTFLEPLAVGAPEIAGHAASEGNVFVARDAAFRRRNGEEGFSALVFKTDDAERDHEDFERLGLSAGSMLSFSRGFADAEGNSGTASFRLAFAADQRHEDVLFFTCQRIGEPNVDRSALQRHANGVAGIKAVTLVAADLADAMDVLRQVCRASISEEDDVRYLALNGSRLEVSAQDEVAAISGLRLDGIVFAVEDLAATQDLFKVAGIAYMRRGARLVVPPAPGQGATFCFEGS